MADNGRGSSGDGEELRLSQIGTAIGVVSLINNLIDLYDRGQTAIREYRNFDNKTMEYLIWFSREIQRIQLWCMNLGYQMDPNGRFRKLNDTPLLRAAEQRGKLGLVGLHVTGITNVLERIVNTFKSISDIGLQQVTEFVNGMRPMPGPAGGAVWDNMSDLLISGNMRPRPASWDDKTKNIIIGAHESLKEDLSSLQRQNMELEAFVSSETVDSLLRDIVPATLSGVDTRVRQGVARMHSRMDGLQSDMAGLFSVWEGAHGVDQSVEEAMWMSMTSIKFLRSEISLPPTSGQPTHPLTRQDLEFDDEQSISRDARQIVKYQQTDYLLELNLDIELSSETPAGAARVRERLHMLALGLSYSPQSFRTLKPVSSVELFDGFEYYYGILYQLPEGVDRQTHKIVCLRDLLLSKPSDCQCSCSSCSNCSNKHGDEQGMVSVPPLGKRFQLAVALLKAFRKFQASHWLHQGIFSGNVLYTLPIQSSEATSPINFEDFWIVGFDFARRVGAESDRRRQALESYPVYSYQHPLRLQPGQDGRLRRYRAEFDIYSIGRLLLEIGVWEVVDEETDLEEAMERLPEMVGERYTSAVQWCLGKSEESPMKNEAIESTLAPNEGGWPEVLIQGFDANVMLCIARGCQA